MSLSRLWYAVPPTKGSTTDGQWSLPRLNHRLPRGEAHSEGVQGATDLHHQIADTLLPQADPVFDDTAAFDTTGDMLNP